MRAVKRNAVLIGLLAAGVWAASAVPARGQLLFINEFMATNDTTIDDEYGEYDDWVEIYNGGGTAVDIGGMYVTDDLSDLTKAQIPAGYPATTTIPAGGFLIIWFDDVATQGPLHVAMKLSADGEDIGLVAADGTSVIDSLNFDVQSTDVSMGRQPDGSATWYYFADATPGASNTTAGSPGYASSPVFSHAAGFRAGSFSLTLSSPDPNATIYYTLDGSEPTEGASHNPYTYRYEEYYGGSTETRYYDTYQYSGPIAISSTTVVRAKAVRPGYMPSQTVTRTFILEAAPTLPVISLSSTPANLWDDLIGIFVMGPPPYTGTRFGSANVWEDWERAAYLELFEPDGTLGVSQGIGVKTGGDISRLGPQKPMALYARSAYGAGEIDYRVFPDRDIDVFEGLTLRCSGDDWSYTLFQDALTTWGLVDELDLDTHAYRPAHIYLNGEYYGIINIRERRNDQYVASHYNIEPTEVDILVDNMDVAAGDATHYQGLLDYIRANDLRYPAPFAHVRTFMEVDNYLDYMASEIYIANTDWPSGNTRYWRPRVDNGRWRWMLIDTDYAFCSPRPNSRVVETGLYEQYDMIEHATTATSSHWSNKPWSTELFRTLLQNGDFQTRFIRDMADHMNVTFRPDRVLAEIAEKQALLEPEMLDHIGRWGGVYNPWSGTINPWLVGIPSMSQWENEIQRQMDFATSRAPYVRQHVISHFGLSGSAEITFNVSPAEAGRVKVNRLVLPTEPSGACAGTYFLDVPIKVMAMPNRGYRFANWTECSGGPSMLMTPTGTATLTANFVADAGNTNPIIINEINYNSAADFDAQDWIELFNPNDWEVDLSGWQFTDSDPNNVYVFPPHTSIGPRDYLVLCNNQVYFHSFFPQVENYIGDFTFNASNGGEQISLYDADGYLIDTVTYGDVSPWPTAPDGTGPTLELICPATDNGAASSWAASTGHGTPGAINSVTACGPQITQQPQDASISLVQGATFSVTAAGSGTLHYRWEKNGMEVGGDSASLHLTGLELTDTGAAVVCYVSNACGTVASRTAILEVTPPSILVVDSAAAAGGDGYTWATAYNDLQAALTAAAGSGGVVAEIWVAGGTYRPDQGTNRRDLSFQLLNGLSIYGGFSGQETDRSQRRPNHNVTVLSGDIGAVGSNSDNSYHVVVGSGTDNTAVLDGVTITGGNATGSTENMGGGLLNAAGSPSLRHCILIDNVAMYGGGVCNLGGSPVLTNCRLIGNMSFYFGGGICNFDSNPVLISCTLSGNGNFTSADGGGIYCAGTSSPSLNSTILWLNSRSGGTSESAQIYAGTGAPAVDYCCIQGWTGGLGGTGNIGQDPLFADADGADDDPNTFGDNDYHLTSTSPCRDAGDPGLAAGDQLDMDFLPRMVGGRVDIGADEFLWPGDANLDGAVSLGDLSVLAAHYGTVSGMTWADGDFTGDGAVSLADLSILAAYYGQGYGAAAGIVMSFEEAYKQVFGEAPAVLDDCPQDAEPAELPGSACGILGMALIGLIVFGCLLLPGWREVTTRGVSFRRD